jgi:hypothetical protein
VIQEIAMAASRGILYCGKETLPWKDFADAVSLFVKVETARGRLADLMKREVLFGHMPDFFGDISSLGAAMLVKATHTLFRLSSTTGERQPVLSLEYLVSSLSVFEATQPRDTIYALLSIAKDATRQDGEKGLSETSAPLIKNWRHITMELLSRSFTSQKYNVDYTLPVIDVYTDFIKFSIRKSDKARALDILCRPWAPSVLAKHDRPDYLTVSSSKNTKQIDGDDDDDDDKEVPLPSWIPNLNGAAFAMKEHFSAGQPVLRMERQNADPLVGMPGSDRIYTAAGDRPLLLSTLAFKSWHDVQGAYNRSREHCLFVEGFELDEVAVVGPGALNGNMPYSWLKLGGWLDVNADPPDEFWRTLVADRGERESNPPSYFPRACKEILKFKTKARMRGSLNIQNLISEGRCSTVAEFLRRVQEVIWNRHMVRTKGGRLGLVRDDVRPGDKVCILYGCSVPVIIRQFHKDHEQLLAEQHANYHAWLRLREKMVLSIQRTWRLRRTKKILIPEDKLTDIKRPRHHEDFQTSKVAQTGCIDELDHLRAIGKQMAEEHEAIEFKRAALSIHKGYYRVLGESYIHGIMNGEAIFLQNRDYLSSYPFELR